MGAVATLIGRMAKSARKTDKKKNQQLTVRQFYTMDHRFALARLCINWLGAIATLAVIGWWISMVAGKETYFEWVSQAVVDLKLNQWFAWTVAGLFGLNSWRLAKARKNVIERYHPYRKSFEQSADPNRSSSGDWTQPRDSK